MKTGARRLSGAVAASAVCIMLGSVAAQATPVLNPADYYTSYSGSISGGVLNGENVSHPFHGEPVFSDSISGSSSHGLDGHTAWSASTTNTYSPTPTLQVDASVTGRGSSAHGDSTVAYWVTFQVPDGQDDVADLPVTLTSSASVAKTGGGESRAYLDFYVRGTGTAIIDHSLTTFSGPTSADWSDTFTINTALIYKLILQISTLVNDDGTGSAMIDPIFHLPSGYTAVTSAFAVERTPIPATLPLFISALGGLGFVGWRRRKREQVAA